MIAHIKKLSVVFSIIMLYAHTMDIEIEDKSLIDVFSIQVIQENIVIELPLKDVISLFFVDTTFYNYYWNLVMEIYRLQTPEEVQVQNKNFEEFIKIFCTYNNWISQKGVINYTIRKKMLPFYVQYHCQDHHFQMLEKLSIDIEKGEQESFFYEKKSKKLLHVRAQEEVIDDTELQKINNDLLTGVRNEDYTKCFYALMNGADVNYKNNNGYPLLMYCTITEDTSYQIIDLLLDNGLDINVACQYGAPKIYFEVQSNNIANVKKLLHYGALPDTSDSEMHSPLFEAVANGNLQMVQLLLEYGADSSYASDAGETPLHAIIMNVNEDTYWDKRNIAALLLQYGADINAKNVMGCNPHEYCLLQAQNKNEKASYYWVLIRFFVDYRMAKEKSFFNNE